MNQKLFKARRVSTLAACLVAVAMLGACGGGGADDVDLSIGVLVGGQPVGGGVYAGGVQRVVMSAGQSIQLDASEPVVWTLQVGTTSFEGFNSSFYYQGVIITETALSRSRIALDTYAPSFLLSPVAIRLVAVSTYDSAVVAAVDVVITN